MKLGNKQSPSHPNTWPGYGSQTFKPASACWQNLDYQDELARVHLVPLCWSAPPVRVGQMPQHAQQRIAENQSAVSPSLRASQPTRPVCMTPHPVPLDLTSGWCCAENLQCTQRGALCSGAAAGCLSQPGRCSPAERHRHRAPLGGPAITQAPPLACWGAQQRPTVKMTACL